MNARYIHSDVGAVVETCDEEVRGATLRRRVDRYFTLATEASRFRDMDQHFAQSRVPGIPTSGGAAKHTVTLYISLGAAGMADRRRETGVHRANDDSAAESRKVL